MKRAVISYLICFFVVFTFLSGCQPNANQSMPELEDDSVEWIAPADDIDMEGMNLYWQHDNIQFVADDEAKLSLYVHAERNRDGELSFDDGQDWLLVMETVLGNYPLFPRQYVQLGEVSCVVYNDYVNEDTISHVVVSVQQTASYEIYDCVFNNEEKAFKRMSVYDAQAINFIANSKAFPSNVKNVGTAQEDAYFLVFSHLFFLDWGLNDGIKYIAVDLSGTLLDTSDALTQRLADFCAENGYTLLIDTMDSLAAKGYIKNSSFEEGIIIRFSDTELTDSTLITDAQKWRSGDGAIGSTFTVEQKSSGWEMTEIENSWIS